MTDMWTRFFGDLQQSVASSVAPIAQVPLAQTPSRARSLTLLRPAHRGMSGWRSARYRRLLRHTRAMTDDSASVLEPRHGAPMAVGKEASNSTVLPMTAVVVATVTLAIAVLTLLNLVVQDRREPWVVNDETMWVSAAGALVAALATGAAVVGRLLQRRRGSGAFWSYIGLCVAVPLGTFLVLAWLPIAA